MRTRRELRGWVVPLAIFLELSEMVVAVQGATGAITVLDDVEMVAVPAGEFIMGSEDPEADDNEKPATKVFVGAFLIDKVEVTNTRYLRCIEAEVCTRPVGRGYDEATKADLPVTIVSWQQASAYCRWAGKRLPTEAEWEKAARGTDGRRYPWGNRFEVERANVGYTVGTIAVGSYPLGASPYGVLDMAGNVWEWTSSLYTSLPYDPDDGRENLNARGSRVERGGSWYYGPQHARTTRRTAAGHILPARRRPGVPLRQVDCSAGEGSVDAGTLVRLAISRESRNQEV